MRLRITVLACALAACAGAAVPCVAGAAPVHNRGLTIHAVPHTIIAGEAVLIYGQLNGTDHANQPIYLYHRINPSRRFSLISVTHTNADGQYEFTRAEGVVLTNRSWFVRGPAATHSRTVHEQVAALVSIAPSSASGTTRHPIVFSGHVTPAHAGARVKLQEQKGSSDDWHTIMTARLDASSDYNLAYAWRVPGAYNVRVMFPGDGRNVSAPSDTAAVIVQQTEIPGFSIQSSNPVTPNGQAVTISGTLDQPGTTTGEPNTSVSLFEAAPGTSGFHELTTTTTSADGAYSFGNVTSSTNRLYQVRTTFAPRRHSAVLFEGVQDVVTMQSSAQTSPVGGAVTFTGSVSPDKAGHVVYLQRMGTDNDWHTVARRYITNASTYQFTWTFGTAGTKQFRSRITGGPANIGGASAPVTIAVSQPPLSSLPTS